MNILITGGAGFIGSHITETLADEGWQVTVYDNFSTGHMENIQHLGKKIRVIKGDILDFTRLLAATRYQDAISHHAAQLEIMRAQEDPRIDLETNALGTIHVLQAAAKASVPRIIVASSACVYGQPNYTPQDEKHPTEPNWSYGISKLAAEKYARLYGEIHNLQVTSLRYGIVYGPREWFRRALTIFIKRVASNTPPVIFGKGNQFRDFIFVKDAVAFHNLCLQDKRSINETYNVASGKRHTIREIAKKTIEISGKRFEPIHENIDEGQTSKYIRGKRRNMNDLVGMWLRIEKARALGWEPKTSLEEGIQQTLEWYKKNKKRWRKVASSG